MNPNNRSDKPGKAPDGMDLVPVYSDEAATEDTGGVPGYAPVKISRDRQQMMGVTVEEAKLMNLEDSIRTVGRVVPDETRLHHVHTKFEAEVYILTKEEGGQNRYQRKSKQHRTQQCETNGEGHWSKQFSLHTLKRK